jgi:DNA repair protein RadC
MPIPIAAIPPHERPRERLLARGAEVLTERELLALVIGSGIKGVSALELASSLLAEYGGLDSLAEARPEELAARTGIGLAKSAALVAAFELGRRTDDETPAVLRCAEDVALVAKRELAGLRRERVLVLICDSANRLRRIVVVSDGSIDRSLVPIREVLNAVLRHDGRAFALAHNHPSGDPEPSDADLRATADLRNAADVVDLRFLGHVVVGNGKWEVIPISGRRRLG